MVVTNLNNNEESSNNKTYNTMLQRVKLDYTKSELKCKISFSKRK